MYTVSVEARSRDLRFFFCKGGGGELYSPQRCTLAERRATGVAADNYL